MRLKCVEKTRLKKKKKSVRILNSPVGLDLDKIESEQEDDNIEVKFEEVMNCKMDGLDWYLLSHVLSFLFYLNIKLYYYNLCSTVNDNAGGNYSGVS